MRKRIVSLLLAVALFSSAFVGCGGGASTSTAEGVSSEAAGAKSLSVSLGSEPLTMDPALNQAADVTTVMNHLFEGLTRYSSDKKTVNAQAKDIQVSSDRKTYTITLRDDIKWSDGKPVTAGDFEYAWKRAVDPKTASQYAYIFDPVLNANEIVAGKKDKDTLGIKAQDDKTLVVTLRAPCPYFNELLSFTAYFPLRKDVVEGNEQWTQSPKTYISNGPFTMKEWSHKESITLAKNPNYYDKDKIKLDTIKFVLLEDDSARLAAYQNGEISFCYAIPTEEIPSWQSKPDFQKVPDLGTNFVDFNCKKKPFDDPKVRKALSLAIDRSYLVDTVTKKTQTAAAAFVPVGVRDVEPTQEFRKAGKDFYSVSTEDYEKNVAEAKKLLAEAGYPDGKGFPTVEYATNPASLNNAMAEAIQNMWKTQLGINCTISQQEWSVFIDSRNKGNYQIARDAFGVDFNDPVSMLDLFVTDGGNNSSKYSNPEYDKIIAQVKSTDDNKVRMPLLHQAEEIIMRDMPVAPLTYRSRVFLLNPNVKGYYENPMGFDYFMYATVEG
ncbi:peptide ABC transporter substrate-binding protein [Caproiciproducens galactitolivorans]|uniref:Oligopeptide-binding protein OppA n=1 Tax=Caproiciproducens galactitolivorans TaxID=642589 RepID=A0A4Z0Y961_9FIRM|nr:peptide ABC transporter substrate-binding protein [Caproiciproducens galactitolivorans]QEY34714.1 peptide ABC transporter substrate-binding protein [Caproiciproducens galactitolivorans]TGJ75811.1 oligopeptide-binding protein OppA precursor [Caproiciproducens galactitolivorans]